MRDRRRGIGNVIATAIMIFLIVFTVSQLYVYNIDQFDNYTQQAEAAVNISANKANERLTLLNVKLDVTTDPTDILATLTISNTGGITSHVVSIWFNNLDVSTAAHKRIAEDVFIGQSLSATLSNLDTGIAIAFPAKMGVKVVTELGNSVSAQLLPPGLAGTTPDTLATVQLIVIPPNPITTNNVGVVLTVTNNNNLGVAFTSLTPSLCVFQGTVAPSPCVTTVSSISTPVKATLLDGPSPSSLSFLPFGSTVVFQWTYEVETVTPDASITFMASYVVLSLWPGLVQSQAPTKVVTVRQVGGTSAQSGQGFSSLLGSLVIDITSFQFAKNDGGLCWKTGFQPKGGDTTVFRVHMTNIGSTTVTLTKDSEFVSAKAATGGGGQLQPTEWFIATGAMLSGVTIAPIAFVSPLSILPGQTVAVYFGSASQASGTAVSLPASGSRLFTFMIMLGTQGAGSSFGQSIPFVGLSTTGADPTGCSGTIGTGMY